MSTTHKNATSLLLLLINILVKDKKIKKEIKKKNKLKVKKLQLIYNSVLVIIIFKYLYFL